MLLPLRDQAYPCPDIEHVGRMRCAVAVPHCVSTGGHRLIEQRGDGDRQRELLNKVMPEKAIA